MINLKTIYYWKNLNLSLNINKIYCSKIQNNLKKVQLKTDSKILQVYKVKSFIVLKLRSFCFYYFNWSKLNIGKNTTLYSYEKPILAFKCQFRNSTINKFSLNDSITIITSLILQTTTWNLIFLFLFKQILCFLLFAQRISTCKTLNLPKQK